MKTTAVKKSWWPIGLVTVFVVFISWIATFIGIAVNSRWDLVTPDYYEQEVRYQERINSIQRLNNTTGFAIAHDADEQSVSVQFPVEHIGKSLDGKIKFYRPDNAKLDQWTRIAPGVNGLQSVSTDSLVDGSWKLEASWVLNGRTYYASTNLFVGELSGGL